MTAEDSIEHDIAEDGLIFQVNLWVKYEESRHYHIDEWYNKKHYS